MRIIRPADRTEKPGPADWFTGEVSLFEIAGPGALLVTFAPCARTAWHTHPRGQTLLVVSGIARIGRDGGPVERLEPGDTVMFEPDERHWHGAAPEWPMSHLALAELDEDGEPTHWLTHVTDGEYEG